MAYVYRHIRLDKKEPFYIGIGTDKYFNRAKSKLKRNNLWNKIVSKTDYEIEIIFEHEDYKIIKEKEKEFIALYGRKDLSTGSLSNLTDGGEGALGHVPSLEKRINQSIRQKGIKRPEHSIKIKGKKKPNMLGVLAGERNPMFGKNHTEESKKEMSLSKIGTQAKEKNPMWGKKRPDLIAGNKKRSGINHPFYGKTTSEEVKLKISIALTGIKRTEEQKNNIRIAAKNRKKSQRYNSRLIIDTKTGEIYKSLKEASLVFGINRSTLADWLNGRYKNKTSLIYHDN